MKLLALSLCATNLTTGAHYLNTIIPEGFFGNLTDELEISSLTVNGEAEFNIENSSYKDIAKFIEQLKKYDNQPLSVLAAVINSVGVLSNINDVFDFCDNKIVETLVNSDQILSLSEIVGEQWSQDMLDSILETTPDDKKEVVTNYFNHEQYKADLFLSELGYIKEGEVEIVYKRKAI